MRREQRPPAGTPSHVRSWRNRRATHHRDAAGPRAARAPLACARRAQAASGQPPERPGRVWTSRRPRSKSDQPSARLTPPRSPVPRRLPRGGAGAATLTAAALVLTAPASLPASAAEPPAQRSPGITVRGGETQPVFSRADAVSQTVLIETTGRQRPRRRPGPRADADHAPEGDRHRASRSPPSWSPAPTGPAATPSRTIAVDVDDVRRPLARRAGARPRGPDPGPLRPVPRLLRQLLPAARLRRRAPRQHRHGRLHRLPHLRRPRRAGRRQGGGRLAERPRPRLGAGRDARQGRPGPPGTSA